MSDNIENRDALQRSDLLSNPFELFTQWFGAAQGSGLEEPSAATLATVSEEGRPSARVVLLRGFDETGFVFFTNYHSRKASDLEQRPWAAMTLWWDILGRQIRIEGSVEKTTAAASDTYFQDRPRGNQIGAWTSDQSEAIPDRAHLDRKRENLEQRFAGQDVPRPEHWGGYRLRPVRIEFWQKRDDRLHDRFVYNLQADGTWQIERLSP